MSGGNLLKRSTVYNDRGLHELSLTNDVIEWKRLQKHCSSTERVKVQEIVVATQKNCCFSVHVIDRQPNHIWTVKELSFSCNNDEEAEDWVKCITELLSKPEFKRPKRLLVFVNPNGGGGRCKTIYCRDVEPLFELAGIETTVVYTTSGTQAPEMLKNYHDYSSIDGVVAVGGDGTANLVASAILERAYRDAGEDLNKADAKACKTPVRLGLIPSGSTDLICHKYTIGTRDPSTAALHIIIGDEIEVDTCAVRHKENFLSFFLMMFTRGLVGDLFRFSENHYMRKLGRARYMLTDFYLLYLYPSVQVELKYRTGDEDAEWNCISDELINVMVFPLGLRNKLITNETSKEKCSRLKSKLNNGKLFIFAHQKVSRRDYLKSASTYHELFFGDHSDLTDAESVYHVEATEVILKTKEGCLSLDGEAYMISEPMDLHIRLHQANLRLFARGVEEPVV